MRSKPPKITKQNINNLYRAVRLVWQSARGLTVMSMLLQILQGLLPLVNLFLIKLIVDRVTQSLSSGSAPELWNNVLLY
ncbi:ABC transporter ATP-binding protein, partial [candidate division KSB1 bacterium]|nr:ABC transporter ATP-binding protein [candidate division KSB1 bacterium]